MGETIKDMIVKFRNLDKFEENDFRTTKLDDDYNPYDDNLYESHDMSENLQVICDDLDITARGQKKK
nr:hypothetical protein [Tanacetum cinerariifolium]